MRYGKTFVLGMVVVISTSLIPAIALAQYGGGGPPVGFFGIVTPQSTPAPAAPAPQPEGKVLGASVYNFTASLHRGESNADVTALQTILITDSYLHISAPTGWFGSLTLAAVKEYQTANGISATGFVGPLTRAVLNKGTLPLSMIDENQSLAAEVGGAIQNLWNGWESTRAQ